MSMNHVRAFAQLAPLLPVFSAKVDVAVIQVEVVQHLAALRHDLLYQLMRSI